MDQDMHGAALIDRVIEHVAREGFAEFCRTPLPAAPTPVPQETLATLRLPGGRPLPPSLHRWLAFDASWLATIGWFSSPGAPDLRGGSLSDTVQGMYGFEDSEHIWPEMFADFETLLPDMCFPLVGGSDSRRLLYVGKTDSHGEYPVLVTDIDDMPYVAVMYPGLDVYLAHEAGLLDLDFDTYTDLVEHPVYGARMREHAENTGLGEEGLEIHDLFSGVVESSGVDAGDGL